MHNSSIIKQTKRILWLQCLIVTIALSGCSTQKDITYLQDMEMGQFYPIEQKHEPTIHRNDKLSITVASQNTPELAIPFNILGEADCSIQISDSQGGDNAMQI